MVTCSMKDIWKKPFSPAAGIQSHLRRFQLVLGKSPGSKRLPFSSTQTEYPFSASRSAETLPPNPEPMTIQS